MILVKIDSNQNRKLFNFSKSIKIEIVSFLTDRIAIENFEIDPALLNILDESLLPETRGNND